MPLELLHWLLAQRDADDFRTWLKSHSAESLAALDKDATILFSLSSELRRLIEAHRSDVIQSLQPDILSALELMDAFRSIEMRNSTDLDEASARDRSRLGVNCRRTSSC